MVIAAVNQGDLDAVAAQFFRGTKATKSSADDYGVRFAFRCDGVCGHFSRNGRVYTPPPYAARND